MMAKDAELQTKKQRQRNRKPVSNSTLFVLYCVIFYSIIAVRSHFYTGDEGKQTAVKQQK